MKKLILIPLVLLLFIVSCGEQQARYATTGPEIDQLKSVIADYESGNWDSWLSNYSDTAKIHHNTWEDVSITPAELLEGFKTSLTATSSYSFDDEPIYFEKVITENGKTWVNFWGNWRGTVKGTEKEMNIPVHISANIEDGKIQQEFAMYDMTNWVAEVNKASSMSEEELNMTAKLNTITKAWNTFDADLFKTIVVDNVVRNSNGVPEVQSFEDYKNFMTVFHTGFPDFKVGIDKVAMEGNAAYVNWTVTGTHTGEFMGNKPTGKKITTHGMSVWHFNDEGMAVQEDAFYDNLLLYSQLGIDPPSGS